MESRTLLLVASIAAAAGCSPTKASPRFEPAPAPAAVADPVGGAAHEVVRAGCEGAISFAVPSFAQTEPRMDVVVYTAHPDDEAMYAGGTMDRLVRAGRKVAFVTMSHGEGGRLLERGDGGEVVTRRDYPRAHVVEVRDAEIAAAARVIGVEYAHLHPATTIVDDAFTTDCGEAIAHWNETLPDGVAGVLRRLIADIRARRPRVIVTLDPRDDPQASHHGHHKATGRLVDVAARLSVRPDVPGGAPHVVEELLTVAPKGAPADVTIPISVDARLAMLRAYSSQFVAEELAKDDVAQRPNDELVLQWRATDAPLPRNRTLLEDLVEPR